MLQTGLAAAAKTQDMKIQRHEIAELENPGYKHSMLDL